MTFVKKGNRRLNNKRNRTGRGKEGAVLKDQKQKEKEGRRKRWIEEQKERRGRKI